MISLSLLVSSAVADMGNNLYLFASLSFPVLFFALLFNSLGIFLLKSLPGIEIAQKVIITNLSLSEIFIAIGWIAHLIANLNGLTLNDRILQVIWGVRAAVYCFWFCTMYLLSLDRLVSCIFALKHRAQVNKSCMRRLMFILWILCSVNGLCLLISNTKLLYQIYNTFVWVALDVIAVLIYSFTYVWIYVFTLKRERQRRARTQSQESREKIYKMNPHFMKVVSLIIISFLVFEVVPSITEFFFFASGTKIPEFLEGLVFLSYQMALLVDPLIYLVMQSRIRRFLYGKMRTCFSRIRRERAKVTTSDTEVVAGIER